MSMCDAHSNILRPENNPSLISVHGVVVRGLGEARVLGYPTLNISYEGELALSPGVYAVRVCLGDETFNGASVIGGNFIESKTPKCEVHILDTDLGERYGDEIVITFHARVAGVEKIGDPDQLKEKIARDVATVRAVLQY